MSERSFHRGKMVALGGAQSLHGLPPPAMWRCTGGRWRVKSGVKSEGWQGIRETAAKRRVTRALPIEFPAAVSGCWSPLTWNRPLYPLAITKTLNRRREKLYRIMANSSINLNSWFCATSFVGTNLSFFLFRIELNDGCKTKIFKFLVLFKIIYLVVSLE